MDNVGKLLIFIFKLFAFPIVLVATLLISIGGIILYFGFKAEEIVEDIGFKIKNFFPNID